MASQPPQLPESILIDHFSGIKNTVTPERLSIGELEIATNIDLDDAGQPHRRRGYAQKITGSFHSVCAIGGRTLGVKDDDLGVVGLDYSFRSLTSVGPDPLSYTQVGPTTYFSSLSASGKITEDVASPWGATDDAGLWVSPVLTPTDTLGAISGKMLHVVPYATEIEYYRGRIYLAAGRMLWTTELYLYDYVDRTRNFYQFEQDITMLRAMEDGLYVGTGSGLYFLQGTFSEGHKRVTIGDFSVVRGSSVALQKARVHPQARQGPVEETGAILFLTSAGVCAGFDGGEVVNLTRGAVQFPSAQSAAALYREDLGVTSYIAVADSAGGPSANARIGDFADAEIRRFQGG